MCACLCFWRKKKKEEASVFFGIQIKSVYSIRALKKLKKTSVLFSEFSLTKLYFLWQPPQQQSPRSLICHKELMKRTLGRPTYAFEARQYVVSVWRLCESQRCECVFFVWAWAGTWREWILNVRGCVCVISKKPCTAHTVASLIIICPVTRSASARRIVRHS